MRKIAFVVLSALVFCFAGTSYAQEKIITLKSGDVLRAEILSKENHVYRISSKSLGTVSIKEEDVASVTEVSGGCPVSTTSVSAPSGSTLSPEQAAQVETLQKKIMGNPQLMDSIQSLAKDKQVTDMFSDPALKDAIMRRDVDYLKNNQKFQEFTNNPTVKKVIDELVATIARGENKSGE